MVHSSVDCSVISDIIFHVIVISSNQKAFDHRKFQRESEKREISNFKANCSAGDKINLLVILFGI